MAHDRNKYQSRENRARVRDVLLRDWDPIGIGLEPNCRGEYDPYVGKVYVMLMDERAGEEAIEAYLLDTATGHIGVSPSDHLAERCANTAAILFAMRPEFETH